MASPIPPPIYWAQRKNLVYIKVALEDCKNPVIKIDKKSLYYKGTGQDSKEYELNLPLFSEIKPEESKYSVKDRGAEFVLIKSDDKAPFWKRLCEDDKKHHWIKIDFNKWRDEDDSDEDGPFGSSAAGLEDMMRQMGGLQSDGNDFMDENEKLSDDENLPDLED